MKIKRRKKKDEPAKIKKSKNQQYNFKCIYENPPWYYSNFALERILGAEANRYLMYLLFLQNIFGKKNMLRNFKGSKFQYFYSSYARIGDVLNLTKRQQQPLLRELKEKKLVFVKFKGKNYFYVSVKNIENLIKKNPAPKYLDTWKSEVTIY